MSIVPDVNKKPDLVRMIWRELLLLFKASQFSFVYTLNVVSIFLGFGALISLVLVNSGDFLINILNFLIQGFSIADGEYQRTYHLENFFWYAYLFITLIVYFVEKWWYKRFGADLIIKTKHKMIAISLVVCAGYALVIYFFAQKYGFLSVSTIIFSVLAISTIIANYYYLLVSHIVKFLETKLI
ncbi:MAG: hypothetical protein A2571_02770 [Candidatus Vogelbacteria bacterium RIFOXYD1_FULL_44_32]|uniref:Uncharacterized protein n=1 Tax=Candidatus Vogelbacteria bacterium RIFOXYD1_FULL_44_32 TaxID=1802438 RepID=A0A1G2QDR6_9BACT|nr:MAG: hypothetical protein A2571_02770 [Candidatus Vogelbacteria bacterium RIFOXYD1_FULL_44_32]